MTDIAVLKKLNGSSSQGGKKPTAGTLTPSASKRK